MGKTIQFGHAKGAWPERARRRLLWWGPWTRGLGSRAALRLGCGSWHPGVLHEIGLLYPVGSPFLNLNPCPDSSFFHKNHNENNSIVLVLFAIWTNMNAFSFFMFSCNLLLRMEKLFSTSRRWRVCHDAQKNVPKNRVFRPIDTFENVKEVYDLFCTFTSALI